jgi:outer membrane scaffolding protein for murein synthesis (MipA/OmpV family)
MIAFLYLSHSPAQAQSEAPPDALAAINAAASRSDANALSAAVIDAIATFPNALEAIVTAAAHSAPAYALGLSIDISRAFPAFAEQAAAAISIVTPEVSKTAAMMAERATRGVDTSTDPLFVPNELIHDSKLGPLVDFDFSLGLGGALQPGYEGHDEYKLKALPVIDVTWRDRIFLSWQESFGEHHRRGLGANLFGDRSFRAGPFVTYDLGREESESPRLAGSGDVESALEAGLFAEWTTFAWKISADYKQTLIEGNGHNGSLLTLAGGYGGRINREFGIGVSAWATYASKNYMAAYFGQDSEAGFKDIVGDITFRVDWDENWNSLIIAQWKRLIGDAESSQLVNADSENQFFLGSTIGYKF